MSADTMTVGTDAAHGHDAHAPAHDDAHDDHGRAPAALPKDVAYLKERDGFTPIEWARGVGYFVLFGGIFVGTALLLAVVNVALQYGVELLFVGINAGAKSESLPGFLRSICQFFSVADPAHVGALWGGGLANVIALVLVFVMVVATLLTMGERKWSALMQDRVGPNRARLPIPGLSNSPLAGLPHILSDVFKMLTKEEVVPALGNKVIFHLAPAVAFAPAFVLFAVIPMSPAFVLFGKTVTLQVAMIDQGLLYVFAMASIAVLGTSLAGWASNNKYALLGGIRASAQMISYEVTLGLTLVGLMIVYQSVRLETITDGQNELMFGFLPAWGVLFQPAAIIAYLAAASAEIKRAPFDNPEGESEIVGYFIEYSGLKFGIFMISEFVEVVVFAGLFTALFFGGYHIPWFEAQIGTAFGGTVLGLAQATAFIAKTIFFCWLSLSIRWTFPRFRYDQVMDLGWKYLLPLSLVNVVVTGIAMLWGGKEGAAIAGLLQLAVIGVFAIGSYNNRRVGNETALKAADEAPAAPAHH